MAQLKDLIVSGATRILGKTYSPEFIGKLTGNADTATKATGDSNGQNIVSTYIKNLSINGKTLNIYKGNGSNSSLTIKDKIYAGNRITTIDDLDKFIEQGTFKYSIMNSLEGLNGLKKNDGIVLSFSWDGSTKWGHQVFLDNGYTLAHRYKSTDWAAWKLILDSNNYTSYTVTKTGSGASGTWGINISGNAATSTTTSAITIVANNEVRFTKPSAALAGNILYIGYSWADGSKSKMINEYKFCGGDGDLTAITASSITATSRIYANEWIQFNNYTGLYSLNNNAYFMPNNTTNYGQWKILGSKSSYSGIHFGSDNSYMTVMDSGEHKGFYQESQGRWIFYYNRSSQCIGLGTSSLNTNYRVTIDGGALVSSVINSSYQSGTWVNSLTNSAITLSDATGTYGGWICGPTKNGRIAISTYQANDDKLYFGYGERGRTANSFSNYMYWDGPVSTLYLGRVETSGEVAAISNVKTSDNFLAKNSHGLYISDTSGNYRSVIELNTDNFVAVGYGPHAAGIGATIICGKEIIFQTPQNSWFRTYYKPGDSFTVHLTCGGFCTEYATNLYFTIPIDGPMVGITSASIRSSQGLIIRQNNKYLYGSSAGKYIHPSSYNARLSHGVIWVYAAFDNSTNATNNSACGCTVDVVVTFS